MCQHTCSVHRAYQPCTTTVGEGNLFDVGNTGILEVFAGLTEAALDVPMGGDGVRVGGSDTSSLDDVVTKASEEITLIGVDICLEEDVATGPGVDISLIIESGRIVEVCLSDGVEVEVAEGEMFVDVCLVEVTTGPGVDMSLVESGRIVEVCLSEGVEVEVAEGEMFVDVCLIEVTTGTGVDMSLVESGRIVEVCLSEGAVEVMVAEGEMFVDVCLAEVTTGSTGVDMSLADTGRLVEVCFNDVTASVEMIFEEVGAIIEDVGVVQTTVVERCIKLCNHRSTLHAVPELV